MLQDSTRVGSVALAHDAARARAFGHDLQIETDLLALLQRVEVGLPALAAMEEHLLAIPRADEAEPTILHHLLDLADLHTPTSPLPPEGSDSVLFDHRCHCGVTRQI